jgi:hypothetical protein
MPGMGPMPGMSSSTTTMSGGRRRRAGKRGRRTRRRNMTGGQMSTQSVPKMMGGQTSTMPKMMGGQTSTMPKMMGGQTSTMPKMMGGRMPAIGSKASGGLTRKDLMKHKGRIISRRKHALGKKALKNLVKAGYKAKKGTFKLFRK